jgi:hypothetical protein
LIKLEIKIPKMIKLINNNIIIIIQGQRMSTLTEIDKVTINCNYLQSLIYKIKKTKKIDLLML